MEYTLIICFVAKLSSMMNTGVFSCFGNSDIFSFFLKKLALLFSL